MKIQRICERVHRPGRLVRVEVKDENGIVTGHEELLVDRENVSMKCIVCGKDEMVGLMFCAKCTRSYDQMQEKTADIASVIEWAANRTRAFEQERADNDRKKEALQEKDRIAKRLRAEAKRRKQSWNDGKKHELGLGEWSALMEYADVLDKEVVQDWCLLKLKGVK